MLTLKIQIINFEIIHAQCRGQPRASSDKYFQTVTQEDVKKCLKRIKKKLIRTCLRSPRKDIFVEKK